MPKKADIMHLEVALYESKPNSMFPEWLTKRLRFLKYSQPIACGHCGRKRKNHWTLLLEFRVHDMGILVTHPSEKTYPPLTPVCTKHIMQPHFPEQTEKEP